MGGKGRASTRDPKFHNISPEAENTFISAILPRHCPLVASP